MSIWVIERRGKTWNAKWRPVKAFAKSITADIECLRYRRIYKSEFRVVEYVRKSVP